MKNPSRFKRDFSVLDYYTKGRAKLDILEPANSDSALTTFSRTKATAPISWAPLSVETELVEPARRHISNHKDELAKLTTIETPADISGRYIVKVFWYLMEFPIEAALAQVEMPGEWSLQFGSEVTPGEASIGRVDVFLRLFHGGKHVSNLAVLNIKDSRSVVKQAASLKSALSPHANLRDALAKTEPTEPSIFRDISATYAQQAASYAAEYGYKHVAFFD
ncbi:hypothetical protein B0T24DRAFT_291075 [Lasiosphaeria ovina]|uniref:Uncharacterized protein n=1 Tax=Lasiosphaeria ovina TaxID=92902 RepID=A0AAE0N8U0_9PEZI|nr:hypothetical protein B0T24DRAFT_291075 [Lasiosphaeria ovina]